MKFGVVWEKEGKKKRKGGKRRGCNGFPETVDRNGVLLRG